PWWKFRSELERLGYAVLPFEFRSCCLGADHKRERLFLLAELQDADSPRLEGNEREILEGADRRKGYRADSARPARRSPASRICGRTTRIPNRAHRLRALGNCCDPNIAEWIGKHKIAASEEITA